MITGGYDTYQTMDVLAMSPAERVVFLYSQLVANLRRAKAEIEKRQIEAKLRSIGRAQDIIAELLASLDMERGGEFADRLAGLYTFFLRELTAADLAMDGEKVGRVLDMVAALHSSWIEAARQVDNAETPTGEAA